MVAAEDSSSMLTAKPSTHPPPTNPPPAASPKPPSSSPPTISSTTQSSPNHLPRSTQNKSNKPQLERVEFLYTRTPVEGCDLLPYVVIRTPAGDVRPAESIEAKTRNALSVQYRWNRCAPTYSCARHACIKPAAHQFVPLLKIAATHRLPPEQLDALLRDSFFCSLDCMQASWNVLRLYTDKLALSFPRIEPVEHQSPDHRLQVVRSHCVKGRTEDIFQDPLSNPTKLTEIAFIRNYAPTKDDIGHVLELVCRYVQRHSDGKVDIGPPLSVRSDVVRRIPNPPPDRRMISLATGEMYSTKTRRPGTIRVLSYNILSEIYATSRYYPSCPSWALAWTYRKRNLIREMALFDADILCLQELQADHYDDHFRPYFSRLGYSSCYKVKTRESMGRKGKIDGCATFFRKDIFALREQHIVEYNSIAESRTKESRTLNRCLKGNIGQILILDVVDGSGPIVVANTHLYWDPELTDVKLFQIDVFMQELEILIQSRRLGADVPLILAGDFNSEPVSSVYELISTGACSLSKPDITGDPYNVLASCRLQHNLHVRSSYCVTGTEPAYTNYTHSFVGVLDYIWYGAESIVPTAIMEIPDETLLFGDESETDSGQGLPNAHWSSDHVALGVEFQLLKRHGMGHGPM